MHRSARAAHARQVAAGGLTAQSESPREPLEYSWNRVGTYAVFAGRSVSRRSQTFRLPEFLSCYPVVISGSTELIGLNPV